MYLKQICWRKKKDKSIPRDSQKSKNLYSDADCKIFLDIPPRHVQIFPGYFPPRYITQRFLKILGNSSNICIFHHKIFCPLPLTINKTPEGFLLIIKYSQENEILSSTTLFDFKKRIIQKTHFIARELNSEQQKRQTVRL